MMLAKLMATLEIRKMADAVRVNASSHRTLLSAASIMVSSRGRPRMPCRLARALYRLRDHLIRRAELRLRPRNIVADAPQHVEHRRLLIGGQADQFPAAVHPGLA